MHLCARIVAGCVYQKPKRGRNDDEVRGIAKLKKGDSVAGATDIAAAKAINSNIVTEGNCLAIESSPIRCMKEIDVRSQHFSSAPRAI
jgi:hypothetical protein